MKTIVLVAAFAAAASSASAGTFTTLCDTGVSNCTTESPITTTGIADSNFLITLTPGGVSKPTVDTFIANGYYRSGSNPIGTDTASWITTESGGAPSEAVGTFNYQEVLTTTNFAGTVPVTISGRWAMDNCGTLAWGAVPLPITGGTGTSISGGVGNCTTSSAAFGTLTSFSFTEDVSGNATYYLDFEVGNTGLVTGLLVDNLSAFSVTPEPTPVLLTVTGIGLLGLGARRRRAQTVPAVIHHGVAAAIDSKTVLSRTQIGCLRRNLGRYARLCDRRKSC